MKLHSQKEFRPGKKTNESAGHKYDLIADNEPNGL